jgi:UDPglucose--hexose-1-phosphate uridylyltransferase
LNLDQDPHRRFNPLTREWVLVSPHRASRPWQGQVEKTPARQEPHYDPSCYLCPGNSRAGGVTNPAYTGTFVFENDFSALRPSVRDDRIDLENLELIVAEGEPGICRVMCFSPRHDLTLATMQPLHVEEVIRTWTSQFQELGAMPQVNHVQIFENRGAAMGASNPHPHCQIWSTHSIPDIPAKELGTQKAHLLSHDRCLLCDYLRLEEQQKVRLVCGNQSFIVLVPFWAVWPFEVMVCSRRHLGTLPELNKEEVVHLAQILQQVTAAYDRVFDVPFPYSMGFHQSPTDGAPHHEWHFHAHFYPPLLRSATIRKFMVGFEMLDMPQRDITPESAAAHLQALCR